VVVDPEAQTQTNMVLVVVVDLVFVLLDIKLQNKLEE
jgi:hypothetical protein